MVENAFGEGVQSWSEALGYDEDGPIDEGAILATVPKLLLLRKKKRDFDTHFTVFCALGGLPFETVSEATLDKIDDAMSDYISTSRRDSESYENVMLCDLLVDHWYPARAARLCRSVMLEPFRHRRESLISEISYHQDALRIEFRAALLREMDQWMGPFTKLRTKEVARLREELERDRGSK